MKKILCISFISFLGLFFSTNPLFAGAKLDSTIPRVVIIDVLVGGTDAYSAGRNYEVFNTIFLKHYQTDRLGILFRQKGFILGDSLEFSWKLEGYNDDTLIKQTVGQHGTVHGEFYPSLNPGKYTFIVRVRKQGEDWRKPEAQLIINVSPPIWQLWWFWALIVGIISLLLYIGVTLRVRGVRKQERLKAAYEKELLELEAKALRAQMNPHFIFNCLNSIKSLMQEHKEEKSVTYLTTFSKLIRTLFNNADKKEISLYDEIETCRLYLQLEAMRFDTRFSYSVNVDDSIDLKSVQIPALIIQPFIENAIWHGIVPRSIGGSVSLNVSCNDEFIEIVIEDNGIGREASRQNKSASSLTHQSKGVNLTQSRLELDNLLKQRQAKLEIIDKKDEAGNAAGTRVLLSIKTEV